MTHDSFKPLAVPAVVCASRQQLQLTGEELARCVGVSPRIEHAKAVPSRGPPGDRPQGGRC